MPVVADISGFTAWGSTRDPHQVFTLLESIFQAFDVLAKKYCIFKVETIGDCYVGMCCHCGCASSTLRQVVPSYVRLSHTLLSAACGVPKHNAKHAIVMSRFARAIMVKFCLVVRSLELTLGPDTGGRNYWYILAC